MNTTIFDRISTGVARLGQSAKSIVKVAIGSHRTNFPQSGGNKSLIVLANGPSLRDTIDSQIDKLRASDTIAVNFAANAPDFFDIKPRYYVLADPHFFSSSDTNVESLFANINSVRHEMTLFVPFGGKVIVKNPMVNVVRFNFIGADGFDWLTRMLYNSRRAMPRPRNVLIPSIMIGIWLGYRTIYVAGADHSWTRTLDVDNENRVVSVQPHFYTDDRRELSRITSVYEHVRIHQILDSFAVAFRSYHDIERYARSRDVDVINVTPGSFIDAFRRGSL